MKGTVIVITGSSSGIGRETAYRFARAGAAVVLTYYKGKARGEAAQKKCQSLGAADTLLLHLDVMDDKSIADAARKVKRKFGGVDILVNNAGFARFAPLAEQTTRDIERQVLTNLEGLIKTTRTFLPIVRKGIINIASMAGKDAYLDMAPYCGTKFGVRGFTQSLALEYPRLMICAVNPDMTATRMTGYAGRPPEEAAETVYRAATGKAGCKGGCDVDVSGVMG
ncbi:MAG TPA: SDR family oxidoreductase [Nitrospirota bacterium]